MSSFDSALQSSNYDANGFVGAFTVNVLGMRVSPPEGYSRQDLERRANSGRTVPPPRAVVYSMPL